MAMSGAAPQRGLKASFMRAVVRARRARRRGGAWRALLPGRAVAPVAAPAPDPVQLVMLAIERLAPATFRSATLGQPVEVVVPDAATAAVFRAALARTGAQRPTDRLLKIVVADPLAGGR
jgi:hypothetical protein